MFRVHGFVVLISITITAVENIPDLIQNIPNAESSSLPPHLFFLTNKNQTEQEMRYEECMKDYGVCVGTQRTQIFCAINIDDIMNRTFYTMCEMTYENCKLLKPAWEYITDGACGDHNSTQTDKEG